MRQHFKPILLLALALLTATISAELFWRSGE
jgi:hypothetical protein